MSAAFSPQFDMNVSAGYSNTNQRLPQVDNNTFSFIYSALNNPGFNHDGLNYTEAGTLGENRNGYGGFSPAQIFQVQSQNQTQRFIGSADATWRPFAWMQNQGTAGLDLANNDFFTLCRFGECPNSGATRQGTVTTTQNNFRNLSAKLVSNMTWQARQTLNFKTTLGGDYTNLENDGVNVTGTNLPPGAQNPFQAAVKSVSSSLTSPRVDESADGQQDARPLHPRTGIVPRSDVPHGRCAHGPEQLIRHAVPTCRLSEGELVVDSVR